MTTALILVLLATIVVHELGHAAAALALGLPCKPVLSRRGVALKIGADGSVIGRLDLAIVAAAGPAANALLAVVAFRLGLGVLVLLNLFALLNLLPVRRFDGYLILRGQGGPSRAR